MGERAALTRLRREYSNIQNEKVPHIFCRPTEKNMLVWHYVLHDLPLETPYAGGVYWGKLEFPKEYPLKPPAIFMLTPSGRFEINARLCLSMSDFHPESWNPSWRIESILIGLVSFMLDTNEPRTTGGIHTTFSKRRELARSSFEYNCGHNDFRDLFPEFCDENKLHPSGGFFLDGPPANLPPLLDPGSRQGEQGSAVARAPFLQRALSPTMLVASALVLLASYTGVYIVRAFGGPR